jgi:hypothetical protein
MNVAHLIALRSWTLSWTYCNNLIKTISQGLNHPISDVSNSFICLESISLGKIKGDGEAANSAFCFSFLLPPLLHYLYELGKSVSGQMLSWVLQGEHLSQKVAPVLTAKQQPLSYLLCPFTIQTLESHQVKAFHLRIVKNIYH